MLTSNESGSLAMSVASKERSKLTSPKHFSF